MSIAVVATAGPGVRTKLRDAKERERDQQCDEGDPVDQEDPAGSGRGGDHAEDGRANHPQR